MPAMRCWSLGLVYLGLTGLVQAADEKRTEPPPWQRLLQRADARKAQQLDGQEAKYCAAGQFDQALQPAEALLALRQKVQGQDHWEVVDARWEVETLRSILKRDAADRHQMANVLALGQQADQGEARGRYREVQPLREKILAICRNILGEHHPTTAASYDRLARNLDAQGQSAAAEPLLRQALAIRRRALGQGHPATAGSYNNLANNLHRQGNYAEAEPLSRRALASFHEVLGEDNAETASAYNNLGIILNSQGRYGEAQPLLQKVLAFRRQALREDHPLTALSHNNLASNLHGQGRYAAAEPLLRSALAIYRKVLGEDHPHTAVSYDNLASNLDRQGQYGAAEPLHRTALAISRRVLGEGHPETALCYNNLAYNLHAQGKHTAAEPLLKKALAIHRNVARKDHPVTAGCYHNLAANLQAQGRYAAAEAHERTALAIWLKALGEDHPETAAGFDNLAYNLHAQGRYAAAQPLYQKALSIWSKRLGEGHPSTAVGYNHLAANLNAQGRYVEAEGYWTKGATVFARARLPVATGGLERAAATREGSPLPALAAVLARNGQPQEAWQRFEESLARGTWDDLSARLLRSPAERDRQSALVQALRRLDQLIEGTFAGKGTRDLKARGEDLLIQRRQKGDELVALTERLEKLYGPVAGQVYGRAAIEKALPADIALVGWVDIPGEPKAADPDGEHWAVVLRAHCAPTWVRLRGSGKGRSWTEADARLSVDLRQALQAPGGDWHALADCLRAQRLRPLADHLAARDGLPAVRRLIVLPSPALAGVPLEVCVPDHTVSYAPSGTILAYLRGLPSTDARGMLALADPVFDPARHKPSRTPLPPGGLLVTLVVAGGNAARARLRAEDVLLRYAGSELKEIADLGRLIQQHAQDKEVGVTVWRAGQTAERTVGGGPLGVVLAQQPAPEALAERYKNDQLLAQSRAGAAGDWPELPGTRAEAEKLRQLCAGAAVPFRLLADSDASEQELDRLATSKELAGYRYIHLATHGDLNDRLPLQSAVILSRDHLPDPLKQLEAGRPVYTGRLTAEEVLERWDLHADLVTLSACQTALGKYEGGEGFVGFTQALLLSGARSVCLSLWKVDDTATALLMQRFYANLLGQRPGLKKPLGKAEALAEAKDWLRNLTAEEAARQAAALTQGVARGKGRKALPLLPRSKAQGVGKVARPFAHPYYWAAFVLVGDGD
jgi:tetratricopeptide (TPR) repeat protein